MPEKDGRDLIRQPASGARAGDAAKPEEFGRGEHPDPGGDKAGKPDQKDGGQQGSNSGQPPKKQEKKPFWKRPVLFSVMICVAVVAIIAGTLYLIHAEEYESTDDAFIDGRISHIAPRVAGKVLKLEITDNQIVSENQAVIQIDPAPYIVKVHQAEGALAQAQAQYEQAKANYKVAEANADESDADVIVARANALNAQQNFERFNKLSKPARSQQQLDAATADQASSDAQVHAAEKKAAAMHAMVDAADKTVVAANAAVESANAQLEQAQLDLSYCTVRTGHGGRITRRTVEVGNYVSVGQEILDVVGTDVPNDIWVTANFKETQLKKMERGQAVTISVDSFPDEKLHGHVDSIQNGTGAVFTLLPPENATGNYVKVVQRVPVKIILDQQPHHLLSPGMSVEPEVDVREHQQAGNGPDSNASNSPGGK
jgi:membrane fusion protein (multidrug efflux system)